MDTTIAPNEYEVKMTEHSFVKVKIKCGEATKELKVRRGLGFQALCMSQKTPIEFDCRRADCGICIVNIVHNMESLSAPTKAEADFLRAMHADSSERLACQCRIFGDVEVEVEQF